MCSMHLCMVCGWEAGLCVPVVCQYGEPPCQQHSYATYMYTYVRTYVRTVFSIKICHPKCLENFCHFVVIRVNE